MFSLKSMTKKNVPVGTVEHTMAPLFLKEKRGINQSFTVLFYAKQYLD